MTLSVPEWLVHSGGHLLISSIFALCFWCQNCCSGGLWTLGGGGWGQRHMFWRASDPRARFQENSGVTVLYELLHFLHFILWSPSKGSTQTHILVLDLMGIIHLGFHLLLYFCLLHGISHPFPLHVVSLVGESGNFYDSSGLLRMQM